MSYWNIPEPSLDPPDMGEPDTYRCPECGKELSFEDKVYRDRNFNVIGCEMCIREEAAGYALESEQSQYGYDERED